MTASDSAWGEDPNNQGHRQVITVFHAPICSIVTVTVGRRRNGDTLKAVDHYRRDEAKELKEKEKRENKCNCVRVHSSTRARSPKRTKQISFCKIHQWNALINRRIMTKLSIAKTLRIRQDFLSRRVRQCRTSTCPSPVPDNCNNTPDIPHNNTTINKIKFIVKG